MDRYFVGVDLGQSHDYSTMAVIERKELRGEWDAGVWAWKKEVALRLRHVERMDLGTPYPRVVERITEVTRSRELAGRCTLVVDGTGVGRPVVDLLRAARPGCTIMAVTATGGMQETSEGGYYCVPKRDLIVGLQVYLQCGELELAAGLRHGTELMEEMAGMQVQVSDAGREQYGARGPGHDDLVFAVALGCWGVRKLHPKREAGWWVNEKVPPDLGKIVRGM